MDFHAALAGVTLTFGVTPLATVVASQVYADRHVYRWRALRYAANRAFALARALNRAKNSAQQDACND